MLIDEQDVGCFDQFRRQGRGERRVVEQHLHARFMAHACGRGDGFDGAFQAQAEHCGVGQRVTHGFDVVDGHLRVGAGRVHDGVLAVRVHGDDGGAGRAEHAAHVRGVDARFAERSEQEVGVVVGADRAEHLHGGADACGRRGLVAGFAAGQQLQRAAGDGLARPGQSLCGDGVVRVHGTDHGHSAVDTIQCGENFGCAHDRFPFLRLLRLPSVTWPATQSVTRRWRRVRRCGS